MGGERKIEQKGDGRVLVVNGNWLDYFTIGLFAGIDPICSVCLRITDKKEFRNFCPAIYLGLRANLGLINTL